MKNLFRAIMCFATIFCLRCGLNESSPTYVKDVVAYKEGEGLFVYFILADSSGAMTTSGGKVTLTITWTLHEFVKEPYTFSKQGGMV